jgi:hypothetical protein
MHRRGGMCPHYEDEQDPKRPRPIVVRKKRMGVVERGEAHKDEGREYFRHTCVSC